MKKHGISTVDTTHDMQNAFASVRHPQLDGAVRRLYHECDAELLLQRHRRARFKIEAEGETIVMKNGEGNYMGDANAAVVFQEAFTVPVRYWQQLHREKYTNELMACDPLSGGRW